MSNSVSLSDRTALAAVRTTARVLSSSRAAAPDSVNFSTSFLASSVSSSSGLPVVALDDESPVPALAAVPSPWPCSAAVSSRLLCKTRHKTDRKTGIFLSVDNLANPTMVCHLVAVVGLMHQ